MVRPMSPRISPKLKAIHVVVDVGHHDAYSVPLGILSNSARQLQGVPVLFVRRVASVVCWAAVGSA